jgi:phosphoribosylformylglycinamidine (FGAM) synthase-like enzyme
LVRDVMAMGPAGGVKALLRAGRLVDPKTRAMVDEIKRGAAEYAQN